MYRPRAVATNETLADRYQDHNFGCIQFDGLTCHCFNDHGLQTFYAVDNNYWIAISFTLSSPLHTRCKIIKLVRIEMFFITPEMFFCDG